jgi:hypothetical protein
MLADAQTERLLRGRVDSYSSWRDVTPCSAGASARVVALETWLL